jgi:uncharacterized protein YktB (UPF0637 family)
MTSFTDRELSFSGFTNQDFEVFNIPGLDARMEQLIQLVRPKLHTLGERIAPHLTALCGEEMYAHVAKHARRSVHPPMDTWVAWSSNKKGYKMLPHFQVGLWSTHLFVQFAIIYECGRKSVFADGVIRELGRIRQEIPEHFYWSGDHTVPEVTPHAEMNEAELVALANRLKNVKKAEALCGLRIEKNDPLLQDGERLVKCVEQTFETLLPLYRLA